MDSELSLINLEFGTKQLSGNLALYKRLLGRFASDYENTCEKLSEFAQLNNLEEMQMLVHTIKGVSGNLGLDQLHQSAHVMDASLKATDISQELLTKLIGDINLTLAEIGQLSDTNQEATPASNSSKYSKDKLIEELKHQRFISDDKLSAYLDNCQLPSTQRDEVKNAIDQLDYALALQLIESA